MNSGKMEDVHMQECLENWIEFVEQEIEISGLNTVSYGADVAEFLEKTFIAFNGQTDQMESFVIKLSRLINNQPITFITEDDFEETVSSEGVPISICTRYEHIQKDLETGRYYNNRGICFINSAGNRMYMSNGEYRSRIEITLPYYPQEEIVYID